MPSPPVVTSPTRAAAIPAGLALIGAVVVVAAGLATYDGHIGRFVHAGTRYVSARPDLVRQSGNGYDGQFVYRLALAPFDLRHTAHGITLDTPLRSQRIGLPILAWLLSAGGHAAALPAVLLAVEVLSLVAIAAAGGLMCRRSGRAPAWGLLLAAPAGLVFGVLHDLTEPPEIALVAAGLLLYWGQHYRWSALTLAAAALTRETALVVVAAIALPRLMALVRRQVRPGAIDAAWAAPAALWLGWQGYVIAATGSFPAGRGGQDNVGWPGAGPVGFIRELPHAAWHQWPLYVAQLAVVGYLLVLAAPILRRAPAPVPLGLLFAAVLALCSSTVVWTGYDDARFLVDVTMLATVVLLGSRRPLVGAAWATAAVWVLSLAVNRV